MSKVFGAAWVALKSEVDVGTAGDADALLERLRREEELRHDDVELLQRHDRVQLDHLVALDRRDALQQTIKIAQHRVEHLTHNTNIMLVVFLFSL